jgi:hypothetical protein
MTGCNATWSILAGEDNKSDDLVVKSGGRSQFHYAMETALAAQESECK